MLELELTIDYDNEKIAKAVFEAVKPDNDHYVKSIKKGKVICFKMKAEDAGSLRNTADDLLACIKIAEDASKLTISTSDFDGDSLFE